jgi:zinc transporter ZupT
MIWFALGLGLLTAVANILGSFLATLQHRLPRSFSASVLGLGGGFILGAALLEMLPEVLDRSSGSTLPLMVGVGYLMVFVLEQLLNVHMHRLPQGEGRAHEESRPTPGVGMVPAPLVPMTTGLAALAAFNVHDLLDGLAIGTAIMSSPELGVLVFLAVVLHEVPAGLVVGSVALAAGRSRKEAMAAGTMIGLITLVGIALPFWIGGVSSFLGDVLLALATGTFIYVGATILIPLSEGGRSRWATFSVVLGFAIFAATAWLTGLFFEG